MKDSFVGAIVQVRPADSIMLRKAAEQPVGKPCTRPELEGWFLQRIRHPLRRVNQALPGVIGVDLPGPLPQDLAAPS